MGLEAKIAEDLKTFMKAQETVKVQALRMILAAIKKTKADAPSQKEDERKKPLSDNDVVSLITREVKMRKDSVEAFQKAGRMDLVEEEMKGIQFLEEYLPAPLSSEELQKMIMETIAEVGAKTPQDLGKVMGAIMGKVKGRADGKALNMMIRDILSNL